MSATDATAADRGSAEFSLRLRLRDRNGRIVEQDLVSNAHPGNWGEVELDWVRQDSDGSTSGPDDPYRRWHLVEEKLHRSVGMSYPWTSESGGGPSSVWRSLMLLMADAGIDAETVLDPLLEVVEQRTLRASVAGSRELSPHDADELRRVGIDLDAPSEQARSAELQAAIASSALLIDAYSVTEAAAVIHLSESRVRAKIAERALYAVKTAGRWRLPRWQFDESGQLPGLATVGPHIPAEAHHLAVESFMTTPHADLDIDGEPAAPVYWLAHGGDPELVASLVEALTMTP